MCTLALVVPAPGGVLQIAANRDEFLARPATPPEPSADGRWLAPRDLRAGGTWLGVNAAGLFVGVTNRAAGPRDTSRRSRGLLVLDALESPDAASLHRRLERLDPAAYNGFHLAYADGTLAGLTWSDGNVLRQEQLGPGVHVLTEGSLGAGDDGTRRRLVEERVGTGGVLPVEGWLAVLSHHGAEPRDGTCVHADAMGYGTRSAFVLHRAATAAASTCAWTESRPCTSAARDGTALLHAVGRW
ncbi:MAG TPA: NRDE family protein [Myxococcaceae bacterium]|nr:NRDE family protein [Myxococcaceae bacterium]